jgi:GrpB-like predicted nucleotidyltransferase (UPF0157 family)
MDKTADPFEAWCRLREREGRRVTVIDLYALVAAPRGLQPHELPLDERLALARRALPVAWPGFEVTEGSERGGEPIEVVAYDPEWTTRFETWRATLAEVLGDSAVRIEHVGSTAVPGLDAKPIVDVQISVARLDDEDTYVSPIESVGLQLRTRDAERRFFRPSPDRPRDIHVHVCEVGSEWEREHLLFRDYLRAHPADCRAYAANKRAAAVHWRDDRIAYTDAKSEVILPVLERAQEWARATGWNAEESMPPR